MHRIWENVLEDIAYFSKLGLFSKDWLTSVQLKVWKILLKCNHDKKIIDRLSHTNPTLTGRVF